MMLSFHWTAEGFDASVEDMGESNRLSEYSSLLSAVTDEFDKNLERLKQTSQRFIKGVSSDGRRHPLMENFRFYRNLTRSRK